MKGCREVERLHPYSTNWSIHVKYLRLWIEFHPRNSKSIHLILGDEQGSMIHAIVPSEERSEFQDFLKEGECYFINKFRVKYVKEEISKTNLSVYMVFTWKTWVERSPTPIESNFFTLKPFKDILYGKVHSLMPYVNVLGVISKMGEIMSFADESSCKRWEFENRYIQFSIQDSDGIEILFFATGVYANELFTRFKQVSPKVNLCLLKFWKVTSVGDDFQITNGNGISDVIVDLKFRELDEDIAMFHKTELGKTKVQSWSSNDKRYPMNFCDTLASFSHRYLEDNLKNQKYPK